MSDLSHIDINNVPYNIKDAYTRQALSQIEQSVSAEQQARQATSIVGCYLDGTNKRLNFTNASGNVVSWVSTATFVKDGMVDNVKVYGNYLLVSFNADANKAPIAVPLSDIFNSANYYTKTDVDSAISEEHAQFVAMSVYAAAYNSSTHRIEFKNQNNEILFNIDATPFIKDGMVDNVSISNGYLVITFNTDAGKEAISIPITDIFNPENYYNKTDIDGKVSAINGDISSINTDIEDIGDDIETLQGNIRTLNQYVDARTGYFVCSTEGSTAAKIVAAEGFVLSAGGSIKINMTNANTVNNATLNINSTGAKALYYAGERASSKNSWEAGETVEVYYNGTGYYANNVAGGSGSGDGAFDVSVKFPTSGVEGGNTYTLSGAITVLTSNLPTSKKVGGMSIKFINSESGKYEQRMLTATSWSTNVSNWKQVDNTPLEGKYYNT